MGTTGAEKHSLLPIVVEHSVHCVAVPHAPDSAGLVRHQVVAELQARGIDQQVVDDAAVIVSELVGNAVRHGRPLADGTLRAEWNVSLRMLHVEVEDGGQGPQPCPALPAPDATGGRGLVIVEALSHTWGVRAREHGTSVWAEMPIVPASGRGHQVAAAG